MVPYSKSNNAYTNQCTDDTEVTLKRNPKTDGLRHWQNAARAERPTRTHDDGMLTRCLLDSQVYG